MVGDRGEKASLGVVPDFVLSGGLTMELEAEALQPFDDLAIPKAGQPAHYRASSMG
jgi:hypothetical protein